MPTLLRPHSGKVLLCFFGYNSIPPEMVKTRPVVVLSEESDGLCTVVPLSTKAPAKILPAHHRMAPESLPQCLRGEIAWAKCDLITAVSLRRLDLFEVGTDEDGEKIYAAHQATPEDLQALRACVLHHLGLGRLVERPGI